MLSDHIQNGIETAKLVWSRLPTSEEGESEEVNSSKRSDGTSVESLDYEVIENYAYREEQAQRGRLYVGYYVGVKWFFALLIGIGTGLAAVFINIAVENFAGWKFAATFAIIQKSYLAGFIVYILINLALVFSSVFIITQFAPAAAGSGIPEIKGYLNGVDTHGILLFRTLIGKIFGSIGSVGGGLALGKEGPLVHTGACIASLLGQGGSTKYHLSPRWLQVFKSDRDRRDLVTCGCAAGVAAAFRAPVGGVLFALEEVTSWWRSQLMWRVFFTSAIVAVVVRTAMGWCKSGKCGHFGSGGFIIWDISGGQDDYSFEELFPMAIIGIIGGVLGALFNQLTLYITYWRRKSLHKRGNRVKIIEACLVSVITSIISFGLPLLRKCSPCPESDANSDLECPRPPGMYGNYVNFYSTLRKRHCSDGAVEDLSSVNTNEHVEHALGGWALCREKSLFIFKPSVEHIALFCRAIYLAFLFAPTIALAPFAESFGVRFREEWLRLVYVTLEKAGPAFIAWGQWAATRPDLFSRDLCLKLSNLPTIAPEHSFAYTKNTIEKAFDRKLSEIFDDFEETPVSSGSVVQVHRATLRFRYPGREVKPIVVAVKVQHPGIRESLERDFVIMQWFVKIANINSTLRWLRLDDGVQRVAGFMMSQVDLLKKAEILRRFGYIFCGFEGISFPKPLYPLVHPAVYVETFEEGETVSHYIDDDVKLGQETKNDLVYRGTFAFLNMFMVNNFVHAGMHSRNILLRLQKGKPHIIFLDVGMTAELSASERNILAKLIQSVGTRNGRVAATSALRLSKKQACPDPNAFIEDVEKSFTFWDSKEGGFVNPYECMQRLLEKVRVHRVQIDDSVGTVIVTILALEDWQRKLYLHSEHRVMPTFHLFGPPPDLFPYFMTQSRSERGKRSFIIVD